VTLTGKGEAAHRSSKGASFKDRVEYYIGRQTTLGRRGEMKEGKPNHQTSRQELRGHYYNVLVHRASNFPETKKGRPSFSVRVV